jgi:rhodanese-related sulfurtransferase/DNA-binding transcriptional ArsR family regulator
MNSHLFDYKVTLYEQFARVGKALGSPHRLELLDLLAQGERRVDQLARETQLPIANVSQHLQVLHRARLVDQRRQGTAIYYRLADERAFRLWRAIQDFAGTRLAEITQLTAAYRGDTAQLEAIDAPTLWQRMQDRDITVLDVRPSEEFRAGHLPGARSIPLAELEKRLDELPPGQMVVAYCRGPFCLFADRAAELLEARGFEVVRLHEGVPDWQAAGFPIERSNEQDPMRRERTALHHG